MSVTYTILSSIVISKFTPNAEEIIGDHQFVLQCNRSTTDHMFCIHQILEEKLERNEAMHQLFVGFKKAYDSVRREVLYNIASEFIIHMEIVRLTKCVKIKPITEFG